FNVAALTAAFYFGWPLPFVVAIILAALAFAALGSLVRGELAALEAPAREWPVLAAALARLEKEPFQAPLLVALQHRLTKGGVPASQALKQLDTLAWRLDQQHNPMLA